MIFLLINSISLIKRKISEEKLGGGDGAKWDTFWLFLSLTLNISLKILNLNEFFLDGCVNGVL